MIISIPKLQPASKEDYAYWQDFLSKDEINTILAYPEWASSYSARICDGTPNGVVVEKTRRTDISWLSLNEKTQWLYERIALVFAEVNRRFFLFDLDGLDEQFQLGIYSESNSGHYDWHVDGGTSMGKSCRKLSMALLLSDTSEFEGGELQLKTYSDNAINVEQRQGRAWFFPSYTLHRVAPVTKGVRRSLVVWASGPSFR